MSELVLCHAALGQNAWCTNLAGHIGPHSILIGNWPEPAVEDTIADLRRQLAKAEARADDYESEVVRLNHTVVKVAEEGRDLRQSLHDRATAAEARVRELEGERDDALRRLSRSINRHNEDKRVAEARLAQAVAALEALAKVQYDGTVEGLREQMRTEDWGDVLNIEETTAAYELVLAALTATGSPQGEAS